MLRAAGLLIVSVVLSGAAAAAAPNTPPLLTPDQLEVQALAISLLGDPAVAAARAAALKRLEGSPPASLPDGRATLAGALDEAVYGAVLAAANDPAQPKVIWNEQLPFSLGNVSEPGGRYGGDDPDRIYRTIAVDPAYQYELRGKRRPDASLDFSFDAISGPALWGKAKAALQSRDVDVAPDGSFVITADSMPADGRRNHLQLPSGTVNILVRDVLSDWAHQLPNELTVRRLDAATAAVPAKSAVAQRAARDIDASIGASVTFIAGVWKNPANQLFPVKRGLADGVKGGVVAISRFKLAKNEALVITLDPINAKYLGFEVTDPWFRSADYQRRSTSLNNAQATPNADGNFTYVVAAEDPGVTNWVDTAGLHDGILLIRWELLPDAPQVDKAVRAVRTVSIAQAAASMRSGTPRVTPAERQQWLAARSAAYERRLSPD